MTELYGDGIGRVELVDHMGNDKRVVDAARVSFNKHERSTEIDDTDIKLINFLMRERHTSPFEHCTIQWKFVVPMFVARQHMRHRTFSFNELSRRYTDENIQFYKPKSYRTQHESNRQASNNEYINPVLFSEGCNMAEEVEHHCQESLALYHQATIRGVAREQARMLLPQNLYTEYYGTVSLHNAMHFVKLRLDRHAQYEIQLVAKAMLEDMQKLFPVSIAAWRKYNEQKN